MDDPVLRVQSQLTARDRILLDWLDDHGVLTSFQIAHALFSSLDFCQRRLRTLHRLGLVARFRPLRADGGSYPYHYVLDQLGAEVVAASRDDPPPRRDRARSLRRRWTSSRALAHRLGVNQFFIDLAGYARTHPGAALVEWLPESVCAAPGTLTRTDDPALVRAYTPSVRPDGYRLLFDTIGHVWPVLFWLHAAARERNLRRLLAYDRLAVPVATAARDHAAAAGLCPAEAVWATVHGDGQRQRLAQLAALVADNRTGTAEAA